VKEAAIYKTENGREVFSAFEDGVLAYWTFPHESLFVPTRFGETHVITAGDKNKPALVMLHGAASNLLSWGAEIPRFMGDYFVIAPDIPGEAGKSAPVRPSWDGPEYVYWLEELLLALQIGRISLMGISLGGWIALQYAAQHGKTIDKLVLMTPGGIVPAKASFIIKSVLYASQKNGLEKMKKLVFGTTDILPVLSDFFDLVQKHYTPRFGSPPLLPDDALRGIESGVLMVSGENDAFFPVKKAAKRLRRIRPDALVYIIPHGQHGITESHESIAEFLRNPVH